MIGGFTQYNFSRILEIYILYNLIDDENKNYFFIQQKKYSTQNSPLYGNQSSLKLISNFFNFYNTLTQTVILNNSRNLPIKKHKLRVCSKIKYNRFVNKYFPIKYKGVIYINYKNNRDYQMSKASGMKLGVQSFSKQQQSYNQEPFDNQFLQGQENNNGVDYNINNNISYSQYLPSHKSQDKLKDHANTKDNQQKRLKKLNNGMQRLSVSILQIKEKYKDLDMDQILFKKRNQKKQNQIREFLSQKKAQKIKLNKEKKKRLQRQAKSLQQSIFLQENKQKQKIIQSVQQSLRKMKEQKLQKQIQMKQKAQKDRKVVQMYSKIHQQQKKHPKFFLRKAQQDRKKQKKRIQSQKQFLAKRRQNYKPLNIQQLEQHSKNHEDLIQQLSSVKKAQKQEKYLKILNQNKKLQEIYRGRTYDLVLQQIQSSKQKKNQPLQKFKKMKNYQQYIRQNFVPRTQQQRNKSFIDQNQKHSSMSHRQIKRYKYLQGVSYGQITQSKPAPKSHEQQMKLGIGYLAYMRSLPKRRYDNQFAINQNSQSLIAQLKLKKKPNPLAERKGKKSIQIKISDKPTRDELGMMINQLKNKDKEIQMKQKVVRFSQGNSPMTNTKQIGEQLIFNIQRKLNLLSKL